jgi:hypothetical protein
MGGRFRECLAFPPFLSLDDPNMMIFVAKFVGRLQANVVSTGLLSMLLLPILQRTVGMQAPVEGGKLEPHLTIVASDSTSFSTYHSSLRFLWARRADRPGALHYRARFPESNYSKPLLALNDPTTFDAHDRYSTTKLLDVILARKIAQLPKVMASGVVINSVNPSLCKSDLGREIQGDEAARFQ